MLTFDPSGKPELGIGMVGHGFMGAAHSHGWRSAPHFFDLPFRPKLVALAGRSPAALERAAAQYGWASTTTDWRSLLERDDIQVIDICAQGDAHAEIAIAALEAGKHVLCEKPLANTAAEAETMVAAAAAAAPHGVIARVGFTYRFVPAVWLAHDLIAQGRIGAIRQVRAQYLQDWLADDLTPMSWRLDKAQAGSGALGDIGAHIVDLAQFLTGEQITAVAGSLHTFVTHRPAASENARALGGRGAEDAPKLPVTVDDTAVFTARFEGGALGTFEATRMATGRRNVLRIEVNGTTGSVAFDYDDSSALQYYSAADDSLTQGFRRIHATGPDHPFAEAWWPAGHGLGYDHGFVHEIARFVDDIADGGSRTPTFSEGLHVQRVLEAVERSSADESRWSALAF
ncbi:Gfo/Idh/MocA family protein [Subtercola endophyticus]|uniref:Gfo/Idh/MocA family protein n=1 Tax=Subtercola endophyticus TaxID=2895559 RepID=UPI001E551DF6|nr:Gfo/Idh/MocA family oxidoreductase [Subtercola endophyticus]UFS58817.1 Gfo/Idh/MocA family oxidoreductase [Subtercola endophyticus]